VGAFHFRALSLPLWSFAAALILLGAVAAALRGDRARRLAVLILVAACLPWATAMGLTACTNDPAVALHLQRAGTGSLSFAGPLLLFIILYDAGRLDGHRTIVVVAGLVALATAIPTWTTDLTIRGVQRLSVGMLYPRGGALNAVHVGQIGLWAGVGIAIARRGQRRSRDLSRQLFLQVSAAIGVLAIMAASDVLLSFGVWDFYPLAWLPATAGATLGAWVLWRTNALRAEGVDRAGLIEMLAMTAAAVVIVAIVVAVRGTTADLPLTLAAITAPVAALAWLVGLAGRSREAAPRLANAIEDALVGFAERAQTAVSEDEVARGMVALIAGRIEGAQVGVWRSTEAGFSPLAGELEPPKLDARVRAWLLANREPLVTGDVAALRLGGLRSVVEGFVEDCGADVVVPLVDHDSLVGLATLSMHEGWTPRPGERDLIGEAAAIAAQALTFTGLRREAEARAETAREVEVAEAIHQARAEGDVRTDVGRWRVMACYRPGDRVAADVWTWAELPDGDLLLVIGDVIGRGVSAALISAAVIGAVESAAALARGPLDPAALLELLDRTVVGVAGRGPRLGAFAAVLGHGKVRYAAAGHRGGYRLRPRPDERGAADVAPLAAAGTALGDPSMVVGRGEAELAPGDLVVAVSDGLVEVTDDDGRRWGERRLLRAMRTWLVQAGDEAAEQLVADAAAHGGDAPLPDDLVALVARAR